MMKTKKKPLKMPSKLLFFIQEFLLNKSRREHLSIVMSPFSNQVLFSISLSDPDVYPPASSFLSCIEDGKVVPYLEPGYGIAFDVSILMGF